jgi:hypothetical protein
MEGPSTNHHSELFTPARPRGGGQRVSPMEQLQRVFDLYPRPPENDLPGSGAALHSVGDSEQYRLHTAHTVQTSEPSPLIPKRIVLEGAPVPRRMRPTTNPGELEPRDRVRSKCFRG